MNADWYFDFISPFAYLQLARFDQLPAALDVRLRPVVFGALLQHHGQLGPAEIPSKRVFTYRVSAWKAARLGVPFRMPPSHPFHPIALLRLAVAAGSTRTAVSAIFDAVWGEGADPESPSVIADLGQKLGLGREADQVAARISAPEVKAELRANTDAAVAAGVFGVPTFVLAGEVIWGEDATDMVGDLMADPGLFESDEMRRISSMPMGVQRRR